MSSLKNKIFPCSSAVEQSTVVLRSFQKKFWSKNEVNSVKPNTNLKLYWVIPSQAEHKLGRCRDYPEREYSEMVKTNSQEAPRFAVL